MKKGSYMETTLIKAEYRKFLDFDDEFGKDIYYELTENYDGTFNCIIGEETNLKRLTS